MRGLEENNSDGIVQYGLAKYEGIELRFDFVRVEDGEDRDRVRGGKSGADGHGFNEINLEAIEGYSRPHKQYHSQNHGGYEGTSEGEGKNGANVAEEVALPLSAIAFDMLRRSILDAAHTRTTG